jgi:hypothetical protein
MINPYSGLNINEFAVRLFLDNYQAGKFLLIYYPDKPFIQKVKVEYSFDNWKNSEQKELKYDTENFYYYTFIEIKKSLSGFSYRWAILDNGQKDYRYINNYGDNFYQKIFPLKVSLETNVEKKIAESLSAGKIVLVAQDRASITSWSLGARGVLVDGRNNRLEKFFPGGKDRGRLLIFLDRIGEYLDPALPSLYGEMSGYLKRDLHPYFFPFLKFEKEMFFYKTFFRNEKNSISQILTFFEEMTAHPILWTINGLEEFSKKETELSIFLYFLNSYYIDELWIGEYKITKNE